MGYDSCTMYLTFKMYNSNAFSVFMSCAPITTIKFRIFSLLQKETTQFKNEQRAWIDISPRYIYKWLINTWKDAQNHWSIGKCKSKLQWDTTSPPHTHLDGYYFFKEGKITSVGEDVEKLEPLCTSYEDVKWCSCYSKQCDDSSEN